MADDDTLGRGNRSGSSGADGGGQGRDAPQGDAGADKDTDADSQRVITAPLKAPRPGAERLRPKSAPAWLITFTDIMALMLTFFVLLYSMSTPQEEEWEEFTSALTTGFSKFQSARNFSGQQQDINIERLDFKRALSLEYLETLMKDTVAKDSGFRAVKIFNQGDRLILSLPVDLLFEVGQARVQEAGQRALFNLGAPLSRIRNRIEVIGHTDPRPVTGGAFDSNWDLSLARATEVAAILSEVGYTRSMVVRGMDAARFEELPRSLTRVQRLDFARRVDIVIMRDDGQLRF